MAFRVLLVSLALASCAKPDRNRPNGGAPDAALDEKARLYAELLPSRQDGDGFVETDTCDSVHWSALVGAVSDAVRLEAAFDETDKLHRRPLAYPECYPEFSKSENSRDAYLMVLVYALARQDLELVRRVFYYGREHGWVMGRGALSRTVFSPNMQGLYAQALEHLGGAREPERHFPLKWSATAAGFEAHLAAVSIMAFGMIHGWIPDEGLEVLRAHHAREPRNPFFAALVYRYTGEEASLEAARATLMDERLFPGERLPTSSDRCESWLAQRDDGPSWEPCDDGRTHHGGDFLFTHAVLSGRL
jgi:hypothetical protein